MNQFAQKLKNALSNSKINDHPIQIQIVEKLNLTDGQIKTELKQKLLASHVIYYRNTTIADVEVLTKIEKEPHFLLLGDIKNFASHGGMLGFEQSSSKVSFQVNINAIRQSRIQVSSKVLRLGTPVR